MVCDGDGKAEGKGRDESVCLGSDLSRWFGRGFRGQKSVKSWIIMALTDMFRIGFITAMRSRVQRSWSQ